MKRIIIAAVALGLSLLLLTVMVIGKLAENATTQPATQLQAQSQAETSGAQESQPATLPSPPPTEPPPTWMAPAPEREITASQYFVYDVNTDTFLEISGAPNGRIYPASITKLFTCYVAMQYLQPDTVLTVGDEMSKVALGSSVARLVRGDQLTVAQLTEAMLLPSGNDAAYVLAVNAGRIICNDPNAGVDYAVKCFVNAMNEQAEAVGMTGTHFSNPDGIHRSSHYSTFADIALLGKMSLENPTIMEMAAIAEDQVTFVYTAPRADSDPSAPAPGHWKNTNYLVDPSSPYYCPFATGLKTGKTPSAGNCLLTSFDYNGRLLIIGVFGCPENEDRFLDTLQLFNRTIGVPK